MNYKSLSKTLGQLSERNLINLLSITSFDEQQLESLNTLFLKHSQSKWIKRADFISLMKKENFLPYKDIKSIDDNFSLIDIQKRGHLIFEEFVLVLYLTLLTDAKQRSSFLLKIMELSTDDNIYTTDLINLLKNGLNLQNAKEISMEIIGQHGSIETSVWRNQYLFSNFQYFKQKEYIKIGELIEVFSADRRIRNAILDSYLLRKGKYKFHDLFRLKSLKSPNL